MRLKNIWQFIEFGSKFPANSNLISLERKYIKQENTNGAKIIVNDPSLWKLLFVSLTIDF